MKLITTKQAANLLALSPRTLSRMVRAGTVPHIKINARVVRFSEDGLERWAKGKEATV